MDFSRTIIMHVCLLLVASGCGVKSSKLCEGDIIVIENAGFKFVECWVKDKNGVPRGNGIYEIYKGENLHLRGQTQNDQKIGIWYLYDEDGNIIDECNYSNDKSCVLERKEEI